MKFLTKYYYNFKKFFNKNVIEKDYFYNNFKKILTKIIFQ
jgi:hypothetical protein